MSGISRERCRQRPTATKTSVEATAAPTRADLPMPASPVTSSSPVPDVRWCRTTLSSATRPAIRVAPRSVPGSPEAPRQPARARAPADTSPPIASTNSSTVPQRGSAGDDSAFETVVCETPVCSASRRRLGQPARWCRSWSTSTSSRWGPGGTSGRGSAPIGQGSPIRCGTRGWSRPVAVGVSASVNPCQPSWRRSHRGGTAGPPGSGTTKGHSMNTNTHSVRRRIAACAVAAVVLPAFAACGADIDPPAQNINRQQGRQEVPPSPTTPRATARTSVTSTARRKPKPTPSPDGGRSLNRMDFRDNAL